MASTMKVTCSRCHKRSEIATPAEDHPSPVVWVCPVPLKNGVDLCGHTNALEL